VGSFGANDAAEGGQLLIEEAEECLVVLEECFDHDVVGSWVADELMTIPFHRWYRLTIARRAGASRQ